MGGFKENLEDYKHLRLHDCEHTVKMARRNPGHPATEKDMVLQPCYLIRRTKQSAFIIAFFRRDVLFDLPVIVKSMDTLRVKENKLKCQQIAAAYRCKLCKGYRSDHPTDDCKTYDN